MKKRDVTLNTEAHRESFNQFADALSQASREGWSSADVLRHFLDAAYCAIRGRFLMGEAWDKNEAEYMAIVKQCREPQKTMNALSLMFASTTTALTREPIDFLGPVFMAVAADSYMGQFFTPYHVSRMMAEITIGDDVRAKMNNARFLTLSEPSCGLGGMILAANQVLRDKGLDIAREAHWCAIDIDSRAHRGCYIQLALTDCSADVYRGNALHHLSELEGVRTPAAILFPKIAAGNPPQTPDTPPPPPVPPGTQLTLF